MVLPLWKARKNKEELKTVCVRAEILNLIDLIQDTAAKRKKKKSIQNKYFKYTK